MSVLPLTYVCLPQSATVYLFPQSAKMHYFARGVAEDMLTRGLDAPDVTEAKQYIKAAKTRTITQTNNKHINNKTINTRYVYIYIYIYTYMYIRIL